MQNFCLESPENSFGIAILHKQTCPRLDLASLLAAGRLSNLGCHIDATSAANSLTMELPYVCCGHCSEVTGPLMHKLPSPIPALRP